ncbi:major histocompatibility complex class I-related gene protein-like [Sinocyclocheilus grahami]|uniref:major histocompatibility complex class I-related gene protein-like n=1 Tax=Sinocyclocheilus grahami TaxID=75366 RepID=UPI0007ACF53A|nr:PREDICTED: major histocompatibility complex class I-related gene protein-like [Sinocyclocheilus grahami]
MKFIIFFIYVHPFVYSESHTFTTLYTGINGHTIAGIPEFSAVTTLDGRQIDYYDSEIKELIPRQDWMKEFASTDTWKQDTEIRQQVQQIYKNNIHVLIERFNQSHGVHTYQRMYGCDWDDQTGASEGFNQYGYDGEDYVALDVKLLRYITPVQQGIITVLKWNNDRAQLELLRQYYQHECVHWSKHFLTLRNVDVERRAPEVSLLQKDPSSPVECHATGFYPSAVTIIWLRNGQDHDEDVDLGELLPNVDGTFQKSSTLNIRPEESKKNQYVCVVEHEGNTIQKILTEDEIKSNTNSVHCCGSTEAVIRLVLSALVGVATVILLVYDIRSRRADKDQAQIHTSESIEI